MFADRYAQPSHTGILSRGGPALAVIGVHILIVYGLTVSMGIVELPKFATPIEAVFIDEPVQEQPEPEMEIKPEIENVAALDQEPVPQLDIDVPTPPAEVPIPPSQSAISAAPSAQPAAATQELQTKSRVDPTYPSASRRAGEQGTVRVKVLVDERGRAQTAEVAQSSGFPRLDEAAIEAVRKWRFVAATNGGTPVSVWTQVAITFRLTDA